MRFTLSSSALSSKLATLAKVINSKNSLSILDSFLFEVKEGKLTLTASDNANMMKCVVELIECDGEGAFCVPNRIILTAVKELAEQPLTFEVNTDDNSIRMLYQNGNYRIVGQSADEYPIPQSLEGQYTETTLTAGALAENIQRTLFATANENCFNERHLLRLKRGLSQHSGERRAQNGAQHAVCLQDGGASGVHTAEEAGRVAAQRAVNRR